MIFHNITVVVVFTIKYDFSWVFTERVTNDKTISLFDLFLLVVLAFFACTFIEYLYFLSIACEVTFEDTKVPIENVIGEVGGGFKVIQTLHCTFITL